MQISKKRSATLIVCGALCLLAGGLACALTRDLSRMLWAISVFLAIPFGAAVLLTGVLRFPLAKSIEAHCTKKTLCLTLLTSAALGIGGICNWLWNVWRAEANDEMYEPHLLHCPHIWGAWIGLLVCIVCAVLYVRERRRTKRTSETGVLIDMGLCFLYSVPFACAYVFLCFCLA